METKTRKSELKRASIIDAALEIAMSQGLAAVSMRNIAQKLQLSKSGVFSRLGSSEALQSAVITEYTKRFLADIFYPSMSSPRGLPRLDAIFHRWIERLANATSVAASLHDAVAFSTDPLDDALRQNLRTEIKTWMAMTRRAMVHAVQEGHLRADTDLDALQFELHSLMAGILYYSAVMTDRRTVIRGKDTYAKIIRSYKALPTTAN